MYHDIDLQYSLLYSIIGYSPRCSRPIWEPEILVQSHGCEWTWTVWTPASWESNCSQNAIWWVQQNSKFTFFLSEKKQQLFKVHVEVGHLSIQRPVDESYFQMPPTLQACPRLQRWVATLSAWNGTNPNLMVVEGSSPTGWINGSMEQKTGTASTWHPA